MGCGASIQTKTKKNALQSDEQETEVVTWATKTDGPKNGVIGASNVTVVEATALREGGLSGSVGGDRSKNSGIVLRDADDDDEIEIIYETQPATTNYAANAQEPPEAMEEKLETKPIPLSKEQQQEAAKLADVRKRFENQRVGQGVTQASLSSPTTVPTKASTDEVKPANLELVLGLNRSNDIVKEKAGRQEEIACLPPGAIFDDEPAVAPKKTTRPMKHHDPMKVAGFDADDEELMNSILDSVEA